MKWMTAEEVRSEVDVPFHLNSNADFVKALEELGCPVIRQSICCARIPLEVVSAFLKLCEEARSDLKAKLGVE